MAIPFTPVPAPQTRNLLTRYELAQKVDKCRQLQKQYFKSPDRQVLIKAKQLERELDEDCRVILDAGPEPPAMSLLDRD